jgi:murein DD-endopeptidase MepM/ murein hydrolase activator NlpD
VQPLVTAGACRCMLACLWAMAWPLVGTAQIGAGPAEPRAGVASSIPAGATMPVEPRGLAMPVEGVVPSDLRDTFAAGRPGHPHEAIDIPAPRGAKVVAVDDGKLVKLFMSMSGGLAVYQFDPQGRFAYYYAHLDRYAAGIREGMRLRRGDLIGYVGTSGNAPKDSPHLHFAVFRLGPERQWWKGEAINPYPALR